MCTNPDNFTTEQGRTLDRALRSCESIIDIDVVWTRWRFIGDSRGWITETEIQYYCSSDCKQAYYYYP